MPVPLVGASVNSGPNFLAVAHVGIPNHGTPKYLFICLAKANYSNTGKSFFS